MTPTSLSTSEGSSVQLFKNVVCSLSFSVSGCDFLDRSAILTEGLLDVISVFASNPETASSLQCVHVFVGVDREKEKK